MKGVVGSNPTKVHCLDSVMVTHPYFNSFGEQRVRFLLRAHSILFCHTTHTIPHMDCVASYICILINESC